jgi:hypothetical protein
MYVIRHNLKSLVPSITTMMCVISRIASSPECFEHCLFDVVLLPLPINSLKRMPFVQNITEESFPPFDSKRI